MRAPLLFVLAAVALSCGSPQPTTDVIAPDAPTQQRFEVPDVGQLKLRWKNPRDADFAATVLVRYDETQRPDGKPAFGSSYQASAAFGAGKVVYAGKAETFTDGALPDTCRGYTFQLWSRDATGNFSGGPAELAVPKGAATREPTASPAAMTAAEVDADVQLAWTNPAPETGFAEVRVVRKPLSAPTSPTDGVAVFSGPGTGAAEPTAGLSSGNEVYAVFACNSCGRCNPQPATVVFKRSVATDGGGGGEDGGMSGTDGGGELTPSALTVQLSADGKNVLLSWTNPLGVGLTQVKVLRRLNAAPTGPGDAAATQLFQGLSTNTAEKTDRLLPDAPAAPRVWHYRVYGCRGTSCETNGAGAPLTLKVSQALRGGGYTLIWRHATANVCGDQTQLGPAGTTTSPNWWKSCDKNCGSATARQLDAVQAPNEVATIHTAFATRGFAVGRVLSSEMCRGVETAQGFNFGPAIELSQVLTYFVYDEAQRCPNTMALLNTPPPAGTNTAMVSHAGFTCPIVDSLAWGEAAIYRPNGTSGALFITRVTWDKWSALP